MDNAMIIEAGHRDVVSKKVNKALRREKKLPAIIYGCNQESIPIAISQDDMKRVMKSEKKSNTLISIQREGISVDAMLKKIQYDHFSDKIVHVDFIRVDITKQVIINVPIHCTGVAFGVKNEDCFFDFITRDVRIQCLPVAIPKEIVVDITELHAGQSIKFENLQMPEGLRCLSDPHKIICTVTSKMAVEEEVAATPAAVAEAPAAAAPAAPAAK